MENTKIFRKATNQWVDYSHAIAILQDIKGIKEMPLTLVEKLLYISDTIGKFFLNDFLDDLNNFNSK